MQEPVVIGAVKILKLHRRVVAIVRPWLQKHAVTGARQAGFVALCLLLLSSIILPPASAWAAEQDIIKPALPVSKPTSTPPDTTTEMKQDYAGPLSTQPGIPSKAKTVADVPGVRQAQGDRLPAVGDTATVQAGEITAKRTATSESFRNADGTITERSYMQPIHYQNNGSWQKIDNTLVEDKNAGDAGTVFGKALGQAQSWMSSTTNFQVKDNKWQARFSPSGSDRGMVRVRQGDSQIGFVPVGAKDVAPVMTTDGKGRQMVHYYDLWPGVNVEYTVNGGQVKEYITLKDRTAANQVSFKVVGATLQANADKTFSVRGALDGQFIIPQINLTLNGSGFVLDTGVYSQSYRDGVLAISVDKAYLGQLPDSAFPAVIDPGIDSVNGLDPIADYHNFREDGANCGRTTCKMYTGGASGTSYYDWRNIFWAPYSRYQNTNYKLVVAKMYFNMQTGPGYHGTTAAHTVNAYRSLCTNAFNCLDTSRYGGSGSITSTGEINLTDLYKDRISVNDYGMWVAFTGEEDGNYDDYKEYDPQYSYMAFTWADTPPVPAILSPSTYGQVYADPQVSVRIAKQANPNNNVPLQYEIMVSTGKNGNGMQISSGLMESTQWTVPDGMLQDGSTYYARTRSYDSTGAGYSPWSIDVDFKIDMRTGKDKTQTYDTLGPVDVDLATGNVATSASTHTSTALGGSLGLSLDYNSPKRSSPGLDGQYWNNTTMAGTEAVKRIDQMVDFDWGQSSYSGGQNSDGFSARWTGYFVVPSTGTYYFGANNDDAMTVKLNGSTVYTSSICTPGVCYGSSVSLTGGQVLPIEVTYVENTGTALAKVWAKGGSLQEGPIQSTYLRTAPHALVQNKGLIGSYFFDDGTHTTAPDRMFMQRTDTSVNFNWGTGTPVGNGPSDNFIVRWSGYVTIPGGGNYDFGANSDDGVKITLGTGGSQNTVLNSWVDQGMADRWGGNYTFPSNASVPITVEYFDHTGNAAIGLKVRLTGVSGTDQVVPTAWLSPKAQVLPDGWNVGVDPDGDLSYDRAKINQNDVVLTDSTGSTHQYTYANGGYKPPVNEDGQLTRNADGTYTLLDTDGRTYVFAVSGQLTSVTSPADDLKPAALQYEYSGTPARIKYIRDGIDPSSRYTQVFYSGDTECGTQPSGFDTATPGGMLCAMRTNDGRFTYFYYSNSLLARIAKPGNEYTDYQYDSSGRINGIRDALANDAIAAGVRSNDANAITELQYDVLGRATSVKQPAPTVGASRTEHTIQYLPGGTQYAGATQQHVTGMTEPNGFAHRIEYDGLYRTTKDIDIANLATTQVWDSTKDLPYSTTDPAGFMSTTIYDDEDRPSDSYGPAPTSYYGTDRKPTSTYVNTVPHTQTGYDEGINGAAVAWYDTRLINESGTQKPALVGVPKLHTTGILQSDQTYMGRNFTTNPISIPIDTGNDNIGFSATGKIVFPQAGTYTFKFYHDDGAKLQIADTSLFPDADWWHAGEPLLLSQGQFVAEAGKVYRFRLDYANRGVQGQVEAWLNGPGITDTSGSGLGTNRWNGYLRTDYNLSTSTKAYDNTLGVSTTTTNYGTTPEYGLAQNTSIDPTGLNLTTSMTYETPGASGGYLRQTTKYLPGANTAIASTGTQYIYYGATESRDNPCTTGTVEAYRQGGQIKIKTEPDPDGIGSQTSLTTETIYDDTGKIIATRINTDSWTCNYYDSRGRTTKTDVPAYNGNAARTVQNDYAVGGSPLAITSWDGNGWIVTWMDLLGRTTKYRDVHDDETTTTYDVYGKITQRVSPIGTEVFIYDTYNRLTDQKLDTVTYAHVNYDTYSQTDNVTYPNAGSTKLQYARDALGRTNTYTYTMGNGTTTVSDTATRTQSDQITQDVVVSGSNNLWYSYAYDTAGRLVGSTIGPHTYSYGYGAASSSCNSVAGNNPNAGKNGNRTTQTVDGVTTTFCYDQADRLKSSSNTLYNGGDYDSHGNMTSLGSGTTPLRLCFDSSDRNTCMTQRDSNGNGIAMYYNRDVQGRIVARFKNTLTNWNAAAAGDYYYGYTASGDTSDFVKDQNSTVIEKTLQLPGSVLLTIKPAQTGNANKQYSLPNIHGDTLMTTDAVGTNTSTGNGPANTFTYDPFGNIVSGSTFPANADQASYGWLGKHEKFSESNFTVAPIQMGARVYVPGIARFLQVDPVEGGCSNPYVYVHANPINETDLSGLKTDCNKLAKAINSVRNELQNRYDAIRADKFRLPLFGRMSVTGHQDQFRYKQVGLRRNLKDWDSGGCGNKPGGPHISGDSWKWATRPAPRPDSLSVPWKKVGIYAGTGAVITAGVIFAPEVTVPAVLGGAKYAQYIH